MVSFYVAALFMSIDPKLVKKPMTAFLHNPWLAVLTKYTKYTVYCIHKYAVNFKNKYMHRSKGIYGITTLRTQSRNHNIESRNYSSPTYATKSMAPRTPQFNFELHIFSSIETLKFMLAYFPFCNSNKILCFCIG